MRLPNVENAFINIRKLRDYCLNPRHPLGKHKAVQFNVKLGLKQKDALLLKNKILSELKTVDVEVRYEDEFGERFKAEVNIQHKNNHATVLTIWIIQRNAENPRLVTCYIKT